MENQKLSKNELEQKNQSLKKQVKPKGFALALTIICACVAFFSFASLSITTEAMGFYVTVGILHAIGFLVFLVLLITIVSKNKTIQQSIERNNRMIAHIPETLEQTPDLSIGLSNEVKSSSDIPANKETSIFFPKFEKQFGISFEDFNKELSFLPGGLRGVDRLVNDESTIRWSFAIAFSDSYLVVIPDDVVNGEVKKRSYFSENPFGIILTKTSGDEYLRALKKCESEFIFNDILKMIIPMKLVLYIEKVSDEQGYRVVFDSSIKQNLFFDKKVADESSTLRELIELKLK